MSESFDFENQELKAISRQYDGFNETLLRFQSLSENEKFDNFVKKNWQEKQTNFYAPVLFLDTENLPEDIQGIFNMPVGIIYDLNIGYLQRRVGSHIEWRLNLDFYTETDLINDSQANHSIFCDSDGISLDTVTDGEKESSFDEDPSIGFKILYAIFKSSNPNVEFELPETKDVNENTEKVISELSCYQGESETVVTTNPIKVGHKMMFVAKVTDTSTENLINKTIVLHIGNKFKNYFSEEEVTSVLESFSLVHSDVLFDDETSEHITGQLILNGDLENLESDITFTDSSLIEKIEIIENPEAYKKAMRLARRVLDYLGIKKV